MSNLSKAAVNRRYDELREQLEAGTISKANFKAAADRLYKLYHGKANKAARNSTSQPSAKAKAAGTKPVNTKPKTSPGKSKVQQAVAANKPNPTTTNNTGVRGKPLPSNPKLKSQSSKTTRTKSKLNPQQRRKLGKNKKRGGRSLTEVVKAFSDKLRLTYKKGELVKRGNKVYRSDGKGKLTLVHRKQF